MRAVRAEPPHPIPLAPMLARLEGPRVPALREMMTMEGRVVQKRRFDPIRSHYYPDPPTRHYVVLEVSEEVLKELRKGDVLVLERKTE